MIKIEKKSNCNIDDIVDFYESVGYSASAHIKEGNIFFTAKDEEEIIGIARLCKEEGVKTLRGMQVKKEYQRKGVGKQLLKIIDQEIGKQECWCLPHKHLENFYGRIKFVEVNNVEAPLFLQQRIKKYKKKNFTLIIMKRG